MRGRKGWLAAALTAALVGCAAGSAATPATDWTTYGGGTDRAGDAAAAAQAPTRGFVLPVDGRVTGQVLAAGGTFYAATTAGEVVSFTADGAVRWRVEVGQLAHTCQQLDGYGVVGTGTIDEGAGAFYLADAFGRLHALDLATGAERAGWPVRVLTDYRRELVWGALTIADGAVYVPTAAYCDGSSLGGVLRVDQATGEVARWTSVPSDQGGGGGPWGWGGLAFDAEDDVLYAATSGAFAGGANTGDAYTETAGYGDRLVELGTNLAVTGASHPADLPDRQDLDFVGSPVILERSGCGRLVVAADKDDTVYAWRAGDLAAGPLWSLPLERYDPQDPLLTNLAWSPATDSIYAVTGTQLDRVTVAADCSAKLDWAEPLGTHTENGSPTIAGNTVWFAVNDPARLVGYDARTGQRTFSAPLGGTTVEAPTITGGRLVVGTMSGLVDGFSFGATDPPTRPGKGWAGPTLGWPGPVLRAVRISKTAGLVSVGRNPGACMCTTRQYWTGDRGKTWHETTSLPEHFTASGGHVYLWTGGKLAMIATLSRTTTLATFADGTIRNVEPIPGGVVALVSSRIHGQNWDTAPRVVVVHGTTAQTITLPARTGRPLVESLQAAWPKLTVTATDFNPNPARAAVWASSDGGATWSTG